MHIVFRVAAGKKYGLGHLRRCLTIASNFDRRARVTFLVEGVDTVVQDLVRSAGFQLIDVGMVEDFSKETSNIKHHFNSTPTTIIFDVAVKELVNNSSLLEAGLTEYLSFGAPLIWIESWSPVSSSIMHNGPISLLVAPHFTSIQYSDWPRPRVAVGHKYCVVRQEFHRVRKKAVVKFQSLRLLVTMGGVDPADATASVLSAISPLDKVWDQINVIVGPEYSEKNIRLCKAIAENAHGRIVLHSHPTNLEMLMAGSDLAITGGGTTRYELAFLGVPMVIIPHDRDHYLMSIGFSDKVESCVIEPDLIEKQGHLCSIIKQAVVNTDWRLRTANLGQKYIDGNGVDRIHKKILAIL